MNDRDATRSCIARFQFAETKPPVLLMTMLHVYAIAEPLPQPNAPATRAALHVLAASGLIEPELTSPSGWCATTAGREYVSAVGRVPLKQGNGL